MEVKKLRILRKEAEVKIISFEVNDEFNFEGVFQLSYGGKDVRFKSKFEVSPSTTVYGLRNLFGVLPVFPFGLKGKNYEIEVEVPNISYYSLLRLLKGEKAKYIYLNGEPATVELIHYYHNESCAVLVETQDKIFLMEFQVVQYKNQPNWLVEREFEFCQKQAKELAEKLAILGKLNQSLLEAYGFKQMKTY